MSVRNRNRLIAVLCTLLFIAAAWQVTECDLGTFWARRSHLSDIVRQMFPPDWNYAAKIAVPLFATVQMSVTGTALGAVIALFLAPLCAANLGNDPMIRFVLRLLVQIFRSFPALIIALAATFIFGLGTFAGTVAICIYTLAIMMRLTYEDIEIAPLGAYTALRTMGSSSFAAYFRAVVPSIRPGFLTNALYLLETNVRHSAILGYVGAGGLGLLLNEKVSWREYSRVGMILILLFLLVFTAELTSRRLVFMIRNPGTASRRKITVISVLAALLFILCTVSMNGPDFSHTSPAILKSMLNGFLHPDTAFLFGSGKTGLGWLLLETVCISWIGTLAGALPAIPLAFLNTPTLVPRPVAYFFKTVTVAIRSVPFLIYGLIFIRVTGPGAFAGVLTLGVCSIGLLTKRLTEAIEALDFRAYRALSDLGTPRFYCIVHAILPQLRPALSSAVLYRFDVNIREAAILGLVGAGGIGAPLIFSMNHYDWHETGAIALGLIVLVFLIDKISAYLRHSGKKL